MWSRAAGLALLAACSGGTKDTPQIGDPELTTIAVEVDYQLDAEPYTGSAGPGNTDTWQLFQSNVDALFEGTGVSIEAPSTLSEMGQLGAATMTDHTIDDLLAISAANLDREGDEQTRVFHVLWIDGYLLYEGERQTGVLGVSIGDTGVIAMFKPVIETLGFSDTVRRFGEQATLIHEFGHAIGLVNNGLEMQAQHQDAANGAHCDDDECVMYWANEGASDLVDFVLRYVTTGDSVLFGADCRDDVQAAFESE